MYNRAWFYNVHMDTPILGLDPGKLTGYALIAQEGIIRLGAISQADLLPLLDDMGHGYVIVAEGWEVRGATPGYRSVFPNQVIGMVLGYAYCKGISVTWYTSRWKKTFVKGVEPIPPRVVERLDRTDRALMAKVMQHYDYAMDWVRNLPKDHRPHALDALGLALYHVHANHTV